MKLGATVMPLVWSRDRKMKGVIIGVIRRGCFCGKHYTRLIAKWPDGHKTHLCQNGMRLYKNGNFKIL